MTTPTRDITKDTTRVLKSIERAMKYAILDIKDDNQRTRVIKLLFNILEDIDGRSSSRKS